MQKSVETSYKTIISYIKKGIIMNRNITIELLNALERHSRGNKRILKEYIKNKAQEKAKKWLYIKR